MARFDVYKSQEDGYLLDIQADLLNHLHTRVVVPLMPFDVAPIPAKILNPVVTIDGLKMIMATQYLAAVPAQLLKIPLANLANRRDDITAALDFLFQGF